MKTNRGSLTTMLMLVLGMILLSGVAVNAQSRDPYWGQRDDRWERRDDRNDRRDDRYDRRRRGRRDDYNWGGSFQLRQTALNAGYNKGIEEGRKDRRRGDRFEFRDNSSYQRATTDYNSRFGDRELYRQYYRQGFQNGYRDGYYGY
jgi:hypothetical protein